MSAALLDLLARIQSNTLTALQQSALAEALTVIAPVFPVPDEAGSVNSTAEEPLAREWMAALYTINGEGAGGVPGMLPTNQVTWHINAVTGVDTNDGLTAGTALKTIAQLGLRWRGTAGGGRPILSPSVGTSITVFLDSDFNDTDPLSVILDVDIDDGSVLLIEGAAKPVALTSVLTTASAFARTHAGGQESITDATVADFNAFIGLAALFIDTTTGGVAWLYEPDLGANATGILTRPYTAQTPGVLSALPTPVAIAAPDAYTMRGVFKVYMGQGFKTRSFSSGGDVAGSPVASVFFNRLELIPDATLTIQEMLLDSDTATYVFQECQIDGGSSVSSVTVQSNAGVAFVNCFFFRVAAVIARGGGFVSLFAGGQQGQGFGAPTSELGGVMTVDGDFTLAATSTTYAAVQGGVLGIGNASHWGVATAAAALFSVDADGQVTLAPIQQATSILYGSDGGQVMLVGTLNQGGTFAYHNNGATSAATQLLGTNVVFKLGFNGDTSSWPVDVTTGLPIAKVTNTLAHLDAAQGGPGFGNNAVDPRTMTSVSRIA